MKKLILSISILALSACSTTESVSEASLPQNDNQYVKGVDFSSAKESIISPAEGQISVLACVKNDDAVTNAWHCDNQIITESLVTEHEIIKEGNISFMFIENRLSLGFSAFLGVSTVGSVQFPIVSATCNASMILSKPSNSVGGVEENCYFEYKKYTP